MVVVQARSMMTDEISSAVEDAMTDATPLGRDQGLLQSTAQSFVEGEQSSLTESQSAEEAVRQPSSIQVSLPTPRVLTCRLLLHVSDER